MYGDDFYDNGWNDDRIESDIDFDAEDDDMLFNEALDMDEDDCYDEEDEEDEEDFEGDGQPSEYEEWQDYMGGDDDPREWDYDPSGDFDY